MTTNQESTPWTDERFNKLTDLVEENSQAIKELREESKEQNIKFAAYQQASQWVVNLAFSLIAGATVITVFSAVFKR